MRHAGRQALVAKCVTPSGGEGAADDEDAPNLADLAEPLLKVETALTVRR